ncbi:MAG: glycosyltransferase family 9 protein [Calditrichaeota bacterium]|nr:glycosyltransferase family 9 protein [Calditrichota bacterium]MCB9366284.1 glycosyltransferase family 9 protein [Calditrichota bacterium]
MSRVLMELDDSTRTIAALLFRRVGDSLLATPALRELKARYPMCDVCVISEPQVVRVFEQLPYVDSIVTCAPSPSPIALACVLRKLPRKLVTVDFLSDPRTALACLLSGAKVRAGFGISMRKHLYSHTVSPQDTLKPLYSAIHKARLAEVLGAGTTEFHSEFKLTDDDRAHAESFWKTLAQAENVVAFFVSSRRSYKKWPLEKFQDLIAMCQNELGITPVLIGSQEEEGELLEFAQTFPTKPPAVMACPTLGALAAVLARCRLFLGNDGGPKHLACAVGTPTLTIFCADHPEYWTPPADPKHIGLQSNSSLSAEKIVRVIQGMDVLNA